MSDLFFLLPGGRHIMKNGLIPDKQPLVWIMAIEKQHRAVANKSYLFLYIAGWAGKHWEHVPSWPVGMSPVEPHPYLASNIGQ